MRLLSLVTAGLVGLIACSSDGRASFSTGPGGDTTLPGGPQPAASVTVSPNNFTIGTGATQQLSTTVRDAGGSILTDRVVTWSTANASIANVSASGVVSGIGAGNTTVRATVEGKFADATVSVTSTNAPVASVTVSLGASPISVGSATQATATLRDASGNVLAGRTVTWSSSNTNVAMVSSSGVVNGIAAGTSQITATSGVSGNTTITVTASTGGPVPLIFASDFATALGNSVNAVTDAAKAIHWNDYHPDADQLYVVSASGLGFPAGIANVLRTRYMGVNSADVKTLNQWPEPANGGSLYFRIYYRLDIPNAYGNLASGGHHPIEPVPGACPFQFEFRIGSNSNGTMDFKATLPTGDYMLRLNKFQTYRYEWAFKNRNSSGAYKFEIRVYDAAGTQVGSNANFIRMNTTVSLAADNPDVPMATDCIRALTIGSNGPSGWESVGTSAADAFSYHSGVAMSTAGWIGAYVAGEHP